MDDVSPRLIKELQGFLVDYQTFEGDEVEVTGLLPPKAALELVHTAMQTWKEKQQPDETS